MDNEAEILARIRRVSAELSSEALAINRPLLATLLDMVVAESRLDAARQTADSRITQRSPIDSATSTSQPDTPPKGTETPVTPLLKCRC